MNINEMREEKVKYTVVVKRPRSKKDLRRDLWKMEFYTHSSESLSTGILELRIKTQADLIIQYARQLGFKERKTRKTIYFTTTDWDKYAKLLLYTAIVSSMRRKYKKLYVKDAVETLGFFDTKYWVGLITSRYKDRKYKGILRPIKALKTLLGIVK